MMSTSAPKLSEDILYAVSEQMLFTKPTKKFFGYQVDLCQENAYTNFMRVNSSTKKVFLAQFVKMKHIEFKESIKMYRDVKRAWDNSKDNDFYGPYLVTKEFVHSLLKQRKLCLSYVSVDAENIETTAELDKNKQSNICNFPIQTFSKLFLGKDLSDEDAANVSFDLDNLKIKGVYSGLGPKFEHFLNLNAKEIEVDIYEIKSPDFTSLICANTTGRVERFSVQFSCVFESDEGGGTSDAKLMNWHNLLHSLLISCPHIKVIDVKLFFEVHQGGHKGFLQHFAELVDEFVDKIFPSLSEGNSEAQISILLELNCNTFDYQDLSVSSSDLFKRGDQVDLESEEPPAEEYCARKLRVVDPKGREHRCVFQVLAQEISYGSEVLGDLVSLQSYDGYGHYSYYHDDDYDDADVDYDLDDSDDSY